MFASPTEPEVLTGAAIKLFISQLQACSQPDSPVLSAVQRVDRITQLERLKSVCAAVQAADAAALTAERLAALPSANRDRAAKVQRGVAGEVALARRVSPTFGARLTGLATVLVQEMPNLFAALRSGKISEEQAVLVAAETSTLSLEHRRQVDAELAGRFGTMSDRQAAKAAFQIGCRLDPAQAIKRARKAEKDRQVTIRPAPDTMVYLTALLPVVQGVAAYAALTRHAASVAASGDPRGRGQLMADQLVACVTQHGRNESSVETFGIPSVSEAATTDHRAGSETGAREPGIGLSATNGPELEADESAPEFLTAGLATVPAGAGIEIQLVMTDRSLFDQDDEPAILTGYGPIPAATARHLVRTSDERTRIWVRRLYADPHTGDLVGGDPKRRFFPPAAKQFLIARDQVCRTPWCDAPIRDADHLTPHAQGGLTALSNGNGRCRTCNLTKEEAGWSSANAGDGSIMVTTPTGHQYRSVPPRPPRSTPWADAARMLTLRQLGYELVA